MICGSGPGSGSIGQDQDEDSDEVLWRSFGGSLKASLSNCSSCKGKKDLIYDKKEACQPLWNQKTGKGIILPGHDLQGTEEEAAEG